MGRIKTTFECSCGHKWHNRNKIRCPKCGGLAISVTTRSIMLRKEFDKWLRKFKDSIK
jgi:Zn finger protein HypA/HybF involved in hydrogenase expression